jgi:erythromycin esterase-like protein
MTSTVFAAPARQLLDALHPLTGTPADFDPILERVGDAHVVLIGEASHGTHEFYRIRAAVTKRLIAERGFTAVAVEGDWPDVYRINRYVRRMSIDADAEEALGDFERFPRWMWRNADVLDFVGWLRAHNDGLPDGATRTGMYGLDLYAMHRSMRVVLDYLRQVDPEAAARASERYACFDHFGEDPQEYGYAASRGLAPSCEADVVAQLVELQRAAGDYARRDGRLAVDALFFAEQSARLVRNAEQYYRSMFSSRVSSWNLRDIHMAETLDALRGHLSAQGQNARVVVWAHNSHLGDARATEMGQGGELNLGQLSRQRYGNDAVLVGFSTYEGTVTAASNWDEAPERMQVRPALPGSYEHLFHETGVGDFSILLGRGSVADAVLRAPRLQRAIGVIYRPRTERLSHYFHAVLPDQFDAVLHYDNTRAVEPLERTAQWERGELPDTYPTAL